jgi:hypothetical protein
VFGPDAPRSRQHRVARQSGGRRPGIYSTPVNGVTLCGSATSPGGCHLRAESRTDSDLTARGFVITANQAPDILLAALLSTPLVLWDGRAVYPTLDGKWSDTPIEVAS